MSARKELTDQIESHNLGAAFGDTVEPFFEGPTIAQARTSGVMVERVIESVLQIEMARLTSAAGLADLRRIFTHVFDPMAGATEREEYVTNLQRRPPSVVLGYPRTTSQPPIVSIVLGEEEEDDATASLSDFIGETQPDEPGEYAEYVGIHFSQTFNIYVFSEHPVVTAYVYHLVKLILFGAKPFLIKAGLVEPHLSGGELSPDEQFVPADWFSRVVRLSCKSLNSVPVLRLDPSRYRVGGIFMDDINVDGRFGGVTATGTTTETSEE